MAGQVGLDEGGILEALSKPIFKHKEKKFFYLGRGKGRRVEKIVEDEFSISVAQIIGIVAFKKLLNIMDSAAARDIIESVGQGGPDALEAFWDNLGTGGNLPPAIRDFFTKSDDDDPDSPKPTNFFLDTPPQSVLPLGAIINYPAGWWKIWEKADSDKRKRYRKRHNLPKGWQPSDGIPGEEKPELLGK